MSFDLVETSDVHILHPGECIDPWVWREVGWNRSFGWRLHKMDLHGMLSRLIYKFMGRKRWINHGALIAL